MDSARQRHGRYAFVTLGCPKNLVDSERMLGLLHGRGYDLVPNPHDADFVIINTCGFIAAARSESLSVVDEMLALKRKGIIQGVVVAGCLVERDGKALLSQYPDIDHWLGVFRRDEVARIADQLVGREPGVLQSPCQTPPTCPLDDRARFRITPRHYAYLKIAEGCDRRCSFCTIPAIRGPYVSKPIDQVVAEACELAADGVRELILIAQDTTAYGIDRGGAPQLARLLRALGTVPGIDWIRILYMYPMHISEELIDTMAAQDPILPYLDIPLQHISDRILRRMRRQVDRRRTEALLEILRSRLPQLVLRTTLIVGFPGETDTEFEELLAFVESQRFERLGVFTYSQEPDTAAARLADQVPDRLKIERRDRLMACQQSIAFDLADQHLGRTADVLLDGPVPDAQDAWIGRTYAEAPDIDPVVYVTGADLAAGRIVPCEIVARKDYDLIGAAVGPPS